jgi:hypothetical protein
MYLETQTKKLAQTVFLFTASSLCAILLCLAATARHNTPTLRTAISPVYTYQNPFSLVDNASSSVSPETKAGGVLTKLISVKWFLGLSGLGALWLVSAWYLQGGWNTKKRIRRQANYAVSGPPAKMNPLAVIPPRPVMHVIEEDTVYFPVSTVLRQTTTRSCFAHRKNTAPCQSRFRPVTLVSSQTRLGRL